MTTFPNSPRLIKGALIALDPMNPLASIGSRKGPGSIYFGSIYF
jgi:hypothetical protein